MKRLELNPSDYTTDEIYTAFEYLSSKMQAELNEMEKLTALNKMYELSKKNLSQANVPSCVYYNDKHDLSLKWIKKEKRLEIHCENGVWDIGSAPKEFRLLIEGFFANAIRFFSDSKDSDENNEDYEDCEGEDI